MAKKTRVSERRAGDLRSRVLVRSNKTRCPAPLGQPLSCRRAPSTIHRFLLRQRDPRRCQHRARGPGHPAVNPHQQQLRPRDMQQSHTRACTTSHGLLKVPRRAPLHSRRRATRLPRHTGILRRHPSTMPRWQTTQHHHRISVAPAMPWPAPGSRPGATCPASNIRPGENSRRRSRASLGQTRQHESRGPSIHLTRGRQAHMSRPREATPTGP